ncbi:MAG: phosphopyruvate hydratase [Pseudomonadota bacterium]
MYSILSVHARHILDSRANPTIEVEVELEGGGFGRAIAPAGASTGRFEAHELRDGGAAAGGLGVMRAVGHVNHEIADLLSGLDAREQIHIDWLLCELDGTPNKQRVGANAILATSLAVAHAAADASGEGLWRYLGGAFAHTLPVPLVNIINGGAHADNALDVQEFMIVPVGACNFADAISKVVEVYHALKAVLRSRGLSVNIGDEGGFAPDLATSREALDMMMQAITQAGFTPGDEMMLAIDCAASEYFKDGAYHLKGEQRQLSVDGQIAWLDGLVRDYPVFSIEDGCAEEDWAGWSQLYQAIGDKVQLVGDDVFVTNFARINQGIAEKAANAVLIKPNQIGSLTETMEAIRLVQSNGWNAVISHRSGESEDTTIADLAVAVNAGQIKTGSVARSERTAKYNRLLRIEAQLGNQARYGGHKPGLNPLA